MFVRLFLISALLATPALAQRRSLFNAPPKPKVISTPTPTPKPKGTSKPVTARKSAPPPKAKNPVEAYTQTVKAAFASRWVEAASPLVKDFEPGSVSVVFKLDAEAKVLDVQVTDNASNEAFAKFCEKFVRETTFEKPPEKALTDGQVEIPFTFKVY